MLEEGQRERGRERVMGVEGEGRQGEKHEQKGEKERVIQGGGGGRGGETRRSLRMDVGERQRKKARAKTAEAAQGEKGKTWKAEEV